MTSALIPGDYYPRISDEIDQINQLIYEKRLNNGRLPLAELWPQLRRPYDEAMPNPCFATLDLLGATGSSISLPGGQPHHRKRTWRPVHTLVRFDPGLCGAFKCKTCAAS